MLPAPRGAVPRGLRRSGGTVRGGLRRGGSSASRSVVISVIARTARSKASAVAALGRVTPLTLRTYCIAAASISSAVAAGSSPRRMVMLRHMTPLRVGWGPYSRSAPGSAPISRSAARRCASPSAMDENAEKTASASAGGNGLRATPPG